MPASSVAAADGAPGAGSPIHYYTGLRQIIFLKRSGCGGTVDVL